MPSTKRTRKPRHPEPAGEQEQFILGAHSAPLSALENDDLKDDDELELEAALFGKRRKPKRAKKAVAPEEEDSGLGYLQDHELFTIDAPLAESSASAAQAAFELSDDDDEDGEDEEIGYEDANFDSESDDDSEDDSDSEPDSDDSSAEPQPPMRSGKPSLWEDPADAAISVSLANDKRLRKLGRGEDLGEGQIVGGRDLEGRLRTQFEKLHPKPQWAIAPKASASAPSTALAELLASTATMISAPKRRGPLPSGTLEIERLRDANQSNRTVGDKDGGKGGVVDLSWHPKLPVLSVVGGDRRLRLFNVDGHTNASLLTIHVPSLPFTNTTFHPTGSSVLLTGTRPFYYTYDLESQRCLRSPRSLWGSSSTTSPQSLSTHAFSPDGTLLAIAGRRGALTVLSWGAAGASTVVAELKTGRTGGIKDLVFARDGRELWTLSGDGGEVDCWDLAERRVVRRWRDDGGFGGLKLAISRDGTCAVGSSTGIVNLYSSTDSITTSAQSSSLLQPATPTPQRSIENLTTAISSLSFNPDGQLLCIASKAKKDALRMIHVPSGTAFANWPTSGTPLGHVNAVECSGRGEYMAIGNQRGKVLLYSLKHWLD